jgi:hypothetical protein
MEKTNPAGSLAITGEEDKEINSQYKKNLTWRDSSRKDLIYWKNILKNNGFPLPPVSGEIPEEGRRGTTGGGDGGKASPTQFAFTQQDCTM